MGNAPRAGEAITLKPLISVDARAEEAITLARHHRRRRIEPGNSRGQRCRIGQDRIRLGKQGSHAVVMARCWAWHTFRVRLTPWPPMMSSR